MLRAVVVKAGGLPSCAGEALDDLLQRALAVGMADCPEADAASALSTTAWRLAKALFYSMPPPEDGIVC